MSALCEDWRIPEKAYGCPQCKTFFYRKIADVKALRTAQNIFYLWFFTIGIAGIVTYRYFPIELLMLGFLPLFLLVSAVLFYRIIKLSRLVLIAVSDKEEADKIDEIEKRTWHYRVNQLRQQHPVMGTLLFFFAGFGIFELVRNLFFFTQGEELFSFGLSMVIAATITAASIPSQQTALPQSSKQTKSS
jgi:hypothetical protein